MSDPAAFASSPTPTPRRGEIWFADLSPSQGHEQAGRRPVLIVSVDTYNASRAAMVIALPLTSNTRPLLTRVQLRPPEGGLKVASDILCDQIRAISEGRLLRQMGTVGPATVAAIENVLRQLLRL
jgi:mRNA interferase MazF